MKIYRRVVIDIASMEIEETQVEDYNGAIAECKGGAGSSGTVDYPTYMKTAHNKWLDNTGADSINFSVTALLNTAMAATTPYAGYVAPSVDNAFMGATMALTDYTTPYEHLKSLGLYVVDTQIDSYIGAAATYIDDLVDAHSAQMQDEYDSQILPQFEHGMSDINAVMSSAFVIGRAILLDSKQKAIDKFDKELRVQAHELALKRVQTNMEWYRLLVTNSIELARIYLAAKTEVDELDMETEAKNLKWDLELYQYGTQVMACIAGSATSKTAVEKGSKLGGALSGAASGAMMGTAIGGPGIGTAIGAAVGGIAGYFAS